MSSVGWLQFIFDCHRAKRRLFDLYRIRHKHKTQPAIQVSIRIDFLHPVVFSVDMSRSAGRVMSCVQ